MTWRANHTTDHKRPNKKTACGNTISFPFFLGHSMKSLSAIKLYGQLMTLKLIVCSSNLFHVLWIMAFNKIAVFALWHQMEVMHSFILTLYETPVFGLWHHMELIPIYNCNWCVFHFCDMWSQGGCHVYLVHPIQSTYWAHKLEVSNLNQKNSHFQHLLIIVCRNNSGLNFSLFKGAQVFSIMAFYETHAYSYFYPSYFDYMFLLSQRYSIFLDFMQSFRVLDFFGMPTFVKFLLLSFPRAQTFSKGSVF